MQQNVKRLTATRRSGVVICERDFQRSSYAGVARQKGRYGTNANAKVHARWVRNRRTAAALHEYSITQLPPCSTIAHPCLFPWYSQAIVVTPISVFTEASGWLHCLITQSSVDRFQTDQPVCVSKRCKLCGTTKSLCILSTFTHQASLLRVEAIRMSR